MPRKAKGALVAFKGFDKDLRCQGYQFEVGQTYTHDGKVAVCSSGFHACENPLDVWSYYGLENGNRYCRVHLSGTLDRRDGDSKVAAETVFVESEVTLGEMIKAGVAATVAAAEGKGDDPSGDYAQIGSSGYRARIGSSGYHAQIGSSGDYGVIASAGYGTQAKGADGTWISLAEFADGKCVGFATGCIGKDGLKADTYYVAKGGKLVEAS